MYMSFETIKNDNPASYICDLLKKAFDKLNKKLTSSMNTSNLNLAIKANTYNLKPSNVRLSLKKNGINIKLSKCDEF